MKAAFVFVTCLVLCAPATGAAQPAGGVKPTTAAGPTNAAGDKVAGQAEFRVGAQAFRANKFAVAARSFEQAYLLDPRPETAFSLAQANRLQYYYDKIPWRVQRAVQMYQAYLEALPAGPRAQDAIDRIGELTPILDELRRRGELVPYVPPVRTQIVVGADVDAANVKVDGQPAELWEAVDVKEGVHLIEVEAAGYEPARRKVAITPGRFLPVDVALTPKPGRLVVRTEDGARIYIDGRRIPAPAREIALAPGEHFASVTRRGRQPWSRTFTIGRDQRLALDANLAPTGQRKVARWVLAAGATLAATSAGTALWAYAARRDVEALDEKRRAGGLTEPERDRYNERVDDVRSREQLALGFGLSAAALLGVGAAMWLLDHDPPAADPRLDVVPLIGGGGAGASVRGTF